MTTLLDRALWSGRRGVFPHSRRPSCLTPTTIASCHFTVNSEVSVAAGTGAIPACRRSRRGDILGTAPHSDVRNQWVSVARWIANPAATAVQGPKAVQGPADDTSCFAQG